MHSFRIEKKDMPDMTYQRLVDDYKDMQTVPPESLTQEDKDYIEELKFWIQTKPEPLKILLHKAEQYIAQNTNKKPSKRYLPFFAPASLGTLIDLGAYYTGVKINQEEADNIKNTASTQLAVIYKNKDKRYNNKLIQSALEDLDRTYTAMHNAKNTTGSVFSMLCEVFEAYNFTPTPERHVLVFKEELPRCNV